MLHSSKAWSTMVNTLLWSAWLTCTEGTGARVKERYTNNMVKVILFVHKTGCAGTSSYRYLQVDTAAHSRVLFEWLHTPVGISDI